MFNFKREFAIDVYLKSGSVVHFPKGFFSEFCVTKSLVGTISEISWKINPGKGKIFYLLIDQIEAIVEL